MTYDIPPPLQHKEKIIFGLTFSQLAYALPTFLLAFFIIFKLPLPIEISGAIALLPVSLAGFLMFFDGKKRITDLTRHLRNQEAEVNSDTLKQIIDIKKVENDLVQTSKSRLSILEIIPLNFMIKTEEEKASIISSFQKFLNSLSFPIQIHISSNIIDLKGHFNYLEKQTERYPELFNSYKEFIKSSIEDNNIKNRQFYIIIKEKDNLEIQTKVCEEKLRSLGLKVRRLNTKQLTRLFSEYVANKEEKELKENEVVENSTHFLLSPKKIAFYHDFFIVNNKHCKVLTVTGYPHSVEMGFLDKIISSGEDYDISLHIEPFPIETTMIQLNRELQKQQSDLYVDSKKGILNPSLDIKYKSTRSVLEDLQKGKQKLFNVSLYIICKGSEEAKLQEVIKEILDSRPEKAQKLLPPPNLLETFSEEIKKKAKEEATLLTKKVKADLDGLMIQSKNPTFQMMPSYESMLPLARDSLEVKRNIHTTGLSAFFPFSSPFLDIEDDGVLLGLNKNRIPYIKNIFHLTNANGIILATSGAGKSYFTKLLISRQFMNGCDVIIIDPQGEYLAITEHYKGETITISKDSDTIINPLDLMGHEYLEKRLSLMDLFQIMFGDLTEVQKSILDKAVDLTYGRKGIHKKSWKEKNTPTMQDLYQTLKTLEKKAVHQERVTYRALLNRLGMYTDKGVFSFLNRQTNINFSKNFVCFNIGSMPKQVKPVIMYLVLDYVYMKMKESLKRKLLVIDEAWSLLQTAEESSYVFEIVKTCRKFNLGLLMITQDVADLVGSRAGHAVLANTSYTFLLRQKHAVISNVAKTFNLSQAEKEYLVTAEKGQGILILENEHQELEVIASPKEHELITTNPDEMIAKTEKKKGKVSEKEDINIELDIEQDVYLAKELSIEEQNFLVNNDYVLGNFHNLTDKHHQKHYVKKRLPESPLHTYYVDLIYQEIVKYTDKVVKKRTAEPDIIFTNKAGEEIAIEVETGMGLKKKKKEHDKKFLARKEEYSKKCYIFPVTTRLKSSYTRHQLPLFFRLQIIEFMQLQFSNKKNSIIVRKFNCTK